MKKHLRIAAQQCNFRTREQTLNTPELWREFGFNAEQLFHTHADSYSALYHESVHGELVNEYLDNARKNNIDIIVYMNCHILGPSIADRKDEWAVINQDGSFPYFYETYPVCCLNSPWRDYFFSGIEAMKDFKIIGLFFDGPHYLQCHCPSCQAKFEKTYGKKMDQATDVELKDFTYATVIDFKESLYKKVKSVNPEWQMYFNEGLMTGEASLKDFISQLATNDIVGTEGGFFFYGPPKNHPSWRCASQAKAAEAFANGKPTVIFFAGDQKPWSWYMHTPAETVLCYMSTIGNGASVWYGLHCDPENLYSEAGKTVKRLLKFDEKYDDLYQDTASLADVAVFYSCETAAKYRKSVDESDLYDKNASDGVFHGDYNHAINGTFAMLSHLNMDYNVVTEINLDDLKKHKVVIAPQLAMVSEKTRNAICEYAADGGVVIADSEFGMFDENARVIPGGAFAKEAGFTYTGKYLDHKVHNYCGFPGFFEADNQAKHLPAPQWSAEIQPADGSEVFGFYSPLLPGRYSGKPEKPVLPYAVKNNYGKGTFYCISGSAMEFYFDFTDVSWRNFFGKLIKMYASNDYVLHNATTGVSMTVRSTVNDAVLVHLTNYTSASRPIEKSAVLGGLILEVPEKFTQAVDIWNDKVLQMIEPGKFAIDALAEAAVIKLS